MGWKHNQCYLALAAKVFASAISKVISDAES
jgi:hypothetical protein